MKAENGAALLKPAYDRSDDEDSSAEWQRIKNFVGASSIPPKHPIRELIDREQRKVKEFDEGGAVGGFDVDPGASSTATMRGAPATVVPPPPQPFDVGTLPPAAAPIKAPAPSIPPRAAPITAPAAATPPTAAPTDATYESEAAKTLGMDPAALQAYLAKTIKPGAGEIIGRAGSTLGDAFSRAGGSNSNMLEQFNKNVEGRKAALAGIPEKVSAAGKERYGLSQQLEARDPNSPYSKVVQNSQRPTLKSLGWTDDQVNSVAGEFLNDAVKNNLTYEDTQAKFGLEKAIHEETIGLQKAQLENTKQYQKGQQDIAREGQRLGHPLLTGLEDVFGGGGGSSTPKITSQAGYDALPSGSQYLDHNGVPRIKK